MSHPDDLTTDGGQSAPVNGVRSGERRRLLRGGLAVGPVIMTIASRPVLGQALNCGSVQVQGSLKAGTSLHAGCAIDPYNTGYSPKMWSTTPPGQWPSPYVKSGPSATLFHSPTTGFAGSVFGAYSLDDVLKVNAGGGSYQTFGQYIAAALLNAASGKTPFLSAATVLKMWNDNLSLGYYQVSPGIKWTQAQILNYLMSTMI